MPRPRMYGSDDLSHSPAHGPLLWWSLPTLLYACHISIHIHVSVWFSIAKYILGHIAELARRSLFLQSSMVCQLICLSASTVSPAKTAEPIETSFGMRTWVGPRNYVLYGTPEATQEGHLMEWLQDFPTHHWAPVPLALMSGWLPGHRSSRASH